MKTLVRATAAAALLTVLAGCASATSHASSTAPAGNGGSATSGAPSDGGSSASSSPTSQSSAPSTPTPTSSPTQITSPAPGGGDQVPLPPVSSTSSNGDRIVYVSPDGIAVGADGKTLSTSVQWGGCQEQPQLVVFTQNSQKVVVEVKTVTHYRVGVMCPNIERTGTASATLSAPLSGRPVLDGITGRQLTH